MKKIILLFVLLATMSACSPSLEKTNFVRVGVFDGFGGSQTCIWEAVSAVSLDPDMSVRTITTSDIAGGVLDSLDAIIVPGGGGSRQYLNLGGENIKRIQEFVRKGGGAVGICAGAYLFSDTPGYSCLALNGAEAIDREHDNRGHGISAFTLTEGGRSLFPELTGQDTLYVMYYEGPVLIPNTRSGITYETFAIMQSDVHEEGDAPAGMTNGKPFFLGNRYGEGRVFSSIAHPEGTPGMMWLIPRMIRWTLDMPRIEYSAAAVDCGRFGKEILMTRQDLEYESSCFQTLLYGSTSEKLACLDWLHEHQSWDAKRWVQGLVFDSDPEIRLRAARYIADIQYLSYLPDLAAACAAEKDPDVAALMKEQLARLLNLRKAQTQL